MANQQLNHVKKWLNANQLELNTANFVILHSPEYSLHETAAITIGKEHVKQTKYIKLLGLLLDENLNWKKYHLSEISKKLARICGIFFNVKRLLPTYVSVSLHNSLFASFLRYGIII